MKLLVIDEISMVRADLLDAVTMRFVSTGIPKSRSEVFSFF